MFGHVPAGAEPHALAAARVVKELGESDRSGGPADQPIALGRPLNQPTGGAPAKASTPLTASLTCSGSSSSLALQ